MSDSPEVKAAGGLLVRGQADSLEVAVVHRPRYDDWSFPKGKLERGEGWKQAALREVLEETGLRCELGAELPSVAYRDRKGRQKLVRYWLMTVEKGSFEPNDEVDVLCWLGREEASALLTYERDRELLLGIQQTSS